MLSLVFPFLGMRISGAVAAPSDTPVGSPPSTIASPSPDIDFTEAAEECETDSHGHSCDDIALQKNIATQTDMTSGYTLI